MFLARSSNVQASLQHVRSSLASTSRLGSPLLPHCQEANFQSFRHLHSGYAKNVKKKRINFEQGKPSKFAQPDRQSSLDSIPDFSPPTPPSRKLVVEALSKKLETWSAKGRIGHRITELGIKGPALKELLAILCPEKLRPEASSVSIIKELLRIWTDEASESLRTDKDASLASLWDLNNVQHAFTAEGEKCLDRLCMQSFLRWLQVHLERQPGDGRILAHLNSLLNAVDVRFFPLIFPVARSMVRKIHLHVGPTNSGKTHGALVALCRANTGLYAGPLRLLAHEIWDRINRGKVSSEILARPCNLVTGEEVKLVDPRAGLVACTVEMIDLAQIVDVAVIDEIQMIGDLQRGSAWTTALIAAPAKEVHLCGESSVVPLVKSLAEACGDEIHIHEYKRLSPLKLGDHLQSNLKNIKKGDCIVAFSRSEIFRLKNEIEEITKMKCAVAYGALPPETKSEQAKLFNDPDSEYSVMVASDAIGMGLNLKIKRIVFSSVTKWNGKEIVPISGSQLKQIAGRAGRYGTSEEGEKEGGYATTLHAQDLPVLEAALQASLVPITRAGIQPPSSNFALFASLLPEKQKSDLTFGYLRPLEKIFQDVVDLCQIDSRMFFASSMEHQFKVSPMIEELVPASKELTIEEREKFAIAPANLRDERLMSLLANMVAYHVRGEIISFKMVDEGLDMLSSLASVESIKDQVQKKFKYNGGEIGAPTNLQELITKEPIGMRTELLEVLESLHRGLTLYLWLSFRFPVNFSQSEEVTKLKERTEKAIEFGLEAVKASRQQRLALLENIRGDSKSSQWTRDRNFRTSSQSPRLSSSKWDTNRSSPRSTSPGMFQPRDKLDRWNATV